MTGQTWRERAECQYHDRELFFSLSAAWDPKWQPEQLAETRRICGACPVRVECLTAAYEENDVHAIRAGFTPQERYPKAGPAPAPRQQPTRRPPMKRWEVNPVAVERLVSGAIPAHEARRADRVAAVEQLTAAGWSSTDIARHLRLQPRSVTRLRAEVGA